MLKGSQIRGHRLAPTTSRQVELQALLFHSALDSALASLVDVHRIFNAQIQRFPRSRLERKTAHGEI